MKIYNLKSTKEKRKLLRKSSTDAEKILWERLRNKQLQKLKFFRQHGIGHYIADFYCPERRLVIEIDGSQHLSKEGVAYDREREKFLEAMGIKTLRFLNKDVETNIEQVVSTILSFNLTPSSFEEGERGSLDGGFTFIEILMTIVIIGLLFIPTMQLFSNSIFSTNMNLDLITATNLAQSHMEHTINLNLTKSQLLKLGTTMIPPEKEKPLEMNKTLWRVQREVMENSDPLEVRIHVFREGEMDKPLVSLVTLVEDMMWDSVKAVAAS